MAMNRVVWSSANLLPQIFFHFFQRIPARCRKMIAAIRQER